MSGKCIVPPVEKAALDMDAVDVGYRGTLNDKDLRAGVAGMWCDQGVWNWKDLAESITYRELKAIRILLQ